jgi:uncharacterized protein YecT (DUF1311 family)
LALRKSFKDRGITIDDLGEFTSKVTAYRRRRTHEIEDEVATEIEKQQMERPRLQNSGPLPTQSQAEMNCLAAADLDIAPAILSRTLTEAEMYAEAHGLLHLGEAQKAWEAFAEVEARRRASHCEGGSMHPGIYSCELKRLTIARIADLQEQIEWLKALQDSRPLI